ncbi:hypothetical protein [Actinophytocola sp.]|uniref:hypothetical protein n=1 Tax=Actinophytocola sp. TaxID=1872138 RepID=UPI002ED3033B
MKFLSRFGSPAGFALVLLLFFLLPFVSVSCDVPDYGEAGADYTGSHLVSGVEPDVPAELQELAGDPETPADLVRPPDPGVQLLAIVLAVLAAAGVLTVLIPQLRTRLLSGAGLAAATLIATVVTMVVAQSNLESALIDGVRQSGVAEQQENMQRVESAINDMIHSEIGFSLMVVVLTLIILATGALGLFGNRLRREPPDRR